MSAPLLELRYRISEAEFVRAHRAHLRRSLLTLRTGVLVLFALAIAALEAQVLGGASWALGIFCGLWALLVGVIGFTFFVQPGRIYRGNPGYSEEQRLWVEETGLRLFSGERVEHFPWEELKEIVHAGEFVLVERPHRVPWVIPERAMEKGWDRFDELCRKGAQGEL
jgi:hypothetical protein